MMIKRLIPFAKKYKKAFILAFLCVVGETIFELIIPVLMANIIDVGVAQKDQHYIIMQGVLMAVCALIALVLGILYSRYAAIAGQGVGFEIRKTEFEKVQNFSFSNTDHFSTSSLITRLTSDVTIIQNAICNGFRPLVRAPFMFSMALFLSIKMNAKLALIFIVVAPILGIGLFFIVKTVGPLFRFMQSNVDEVNTVVQENLIAIRTVKAYVKGDYENEKFEKINQELRNHSEKAFRYSVCNMPLFQYMMYTTIVCILFFGSQMIFAGEMKVGQLTGFLSYVLQILNALMMISNVFLMLTRSLASCKRIVDVLDEVNNLHDLLDPITEMNQGEIEFKNVSFKYKETAQENVLSNINLHIEPGSTVGILGGTGSAKTSLVQLIDRLYDVSEGEILIDGHNVKDYSLEYLRDQVGMVLQKNTLFSGTVKENLLWGNKEASDEEIKWACKQACVDEFIENFPEGYDTYLKQGGVNVSGGQKQRLCIARALLKHPKILILDDSTSAVDTATEASIKEALASLKGTTKIIIAQRISSLQHADQIIILDNGHIHAIGNHEELLKNDEIYQEIYDSQLKGVDL